jgi:hypothetical protein
MRTGTPDMAAAQYAARIASGERLRLPESHIDMHCGVTPIRRANAAGVACESVQAALQRIEAPAIIQLNFQAHRGLCGGDKGSQDAVIKNAHAMWQN